MTNKARSFMTMGCILALTGAAHAAPFVFQGQLNDEGSPATGIYDLEFVLYAMDIGGAQIGPTVTLEDQQVTQGQFSVEIDFGDVFDGSERWIEISVRGGDSIDPFTELAPRAKIGNSPQASFASRAGIADALVNPTWTQAPGIIRYGTGSDKIVINRSSVWEPTDVLLVHQAVNGPTGMNISGGAQSLPYYGYTTASQMRAYTYYDPITDSWMVNKNGDQLEINNDNDVVVTNNLIVGGTITSLSDPEPTNDFKSYTPDSIFIGLSNSSTLFNSTAGAIVAQGSPTGQYLRVDINLPHGSIITQIDLNYTDRLSNPNLRVELSTRNLATMAFTQSLLGESSGSSTNVQTLQIQLGTPIVIDNTVETYDLRMSSSTGAWPSAGNLGVRSVLIEYTTP